MFLNKLLFIIFLQFLVEDIIIRLIVIKEEIFFQIEINLLKNNKNYIFFHKIKQAIKKNL